MPVKNRFAELQDEITAWRRDLHAHPEILFDTHRTAGVVAEKLRAFGCDEVVEGVGRTGVVGVIKGKADRSGKVLGLRADMDALPIHEQTGHPWQSRTPGVMHACGHDGHTVMLLAAARYLSAHRDFRGRVALIFQPGEEASGGGRLMVEDGVFDRFAISRVHALHTLPGAPAGTFHTRPGPLLASVDDFSLRIAGLGGHVAYPEACRNPVAALGPMIAAIADIQSALRARFGAGVIEPTLVQAGTVTNIVPGTAQLSGTVRSLSDGFRSEAEAQLRALAETSVDGFTMTLAHSRYYPVLVNDPAETRRACDIATELVGPKAVDRTTAPHLVAEDFAYMLDACPGSFLFLGQGDGPGLHNAGFDFNDAVAPLGASLLVRLAQGAEV